MGETKGAHTGRWTIKRRRMQTLERERQWVGRDGSWESIGSSSAMGVGVLCLQLREAWTVRCTGASSPSCSSPFLEALGCVPRLLGWGLARLCRRGRAEALVPRGVVLGTGVVGQVHRSLRMAVSWM